MSAYLRVDDVMAILQCGKTKAYEGPRVGAHVESGLRASEHAGASGDGRAAAERTGR